MKTKHTNIEKNRLTQIDGGLFELEFTSNQIPENEVGIIRYLATDDIFCFSTHDPYKGEIEHKTTFDREWEYNETYAREVIEDSIVDELKSGNLEHSTNPLQEEVIEDEIKKLERENLAMSIISLYLDKKVQDLTLDEVIDRAKKLIENYENKIKVH